MKFSHLLYIEGAWYLYIHSFIIIFLHQEAYALYQNWSTPHIILTSFIPFSKRMIFQRSIYSCFLQNYSCYQADIFRCLTLYDGYKLEITVSIQA